MKWIYKTFTLSYTIKEKDIHFTQTETLLFKNNKIVNKYTNIYSKDNDSYFINCNVGDTFENNHVIITCDCIQTCEHYDKIHTRINNEYSELANEISYLKYKLKEVN